MLGDSRKAHDVFHTTLREAAVRAAQGGLPREPLWLFRDARWRSLEASKTDLQPEPLKLDEHDVTPEAALQIEQLEPTQLAIWISNAPDPQRTALALFYLDEFDYCEILDIAELKVVITPGAGFGAQGEGYFRISAFNNRANAEEVARRLRDLQ